MFGTSAMLRISWMSAISRISAEPTLSAAARVWNAAPPPYMNPRMNPHMNPPTNAGAGGKTPAGHQPAHAACQPRLAPGIYHCDKVMHSSDNPM